MVFIVLCIEGIFKFILFCIEAAKVKILLVQPYYLPPAVPNVIALELLVYDIYQYKLIKLFKFDIYL